MGLYLDSGYLNQNWIRDVADKNKISFIVEIGGRQVGKTYGTLQLMLKQEKPFILMRRTLTEMEFICNGINSPFAKYRGEDVTVRKNGKYTADIVRNFEENQTQIGSVMALSAVAKIRGFNGDIYHDLVFDEFIPENHVTKIKDEGDAFLNAIVTISGNRELEGLVPLRVWLLANANTIASPILSALNIQGKIEEMLRKGQELSILPERGIMIVLPSSEKILTRRKGTALMRAIDGTSKFSRMAFDNEFAYNDAHGVQHVNIREYVPIYGMTGCFTIFKHKSNGGLHVGLPGKCRPDQEHADTEREAIHLRTMFPDIRGMYVNGSITYESQAIKECFTARIFGQ